MTAAALFEDVRRRIHDPGIDVALDFEVEEVSAVLGIVEGIGHGLVDRHRYGLGLGIGLEAGVNRESFVFH